jgi:hypothetical protein
LLDVIHSALRLQADPARVVVRPFHIPIDGGTTPGRPGRVRRIVDSVLALDEEMADVELELVLRDFEARHWQTRSVFMSRYAQIETALSLDSDVISEIKKQLIGAYFCHEYSYAAAALMNPSVVPHPDQSGLSEGAVRIAMSLRSVGEGIFPRSRFGRAYWALDGDRADGRAAVRNGRRWRRGDRQRRDRGASPSRQFALGHRAVPDDRRPVERAGGYAPRPASRMMTARSNGSAPTPPITVPRSGRSCCEPAISAASRSRR